MFSTLGNTHQAFAATVDAAIPQSSLFDVISARAKKLAAEEYIAPKNIELDALNNIDYQDYRSIRFKKDKSVWKDESLYEVQLFHPGFLYKTPVTINTVDGDSKRNRLPFSTNFYQYDSTAAPLKDEIDKSVANMQLGHAGFRLHYPLNTNE
jgi:glucans biosynthesis protein